VTQDSNAVHLRGGRRCPLASESMLTPHRRVGVPKARLPGNPATRRRRHAQRHLPRSRVRFASRPPAPSSSCVPGSSAPAASARRSMPSAPRGLPWTRPAPPPRPGGRSLARGPGDSRPCTPRPALCVSLARSRSGGKNCPRVRAKEVWTFEPDTRGAQAQERPRSSPGAAPACARPASTASWPSECRVRMRSTCTP
jgi:hypothetical protein